MLAQMKGKKFFSPLRSILSRSISIRAAETSFTSENRSRTTATPAQPGGSKSKVELPDLASPTPCACSPDRSYDIVIGVTGQLSVLVAASALDNPKFIKL